MCTELVWMAAIYWSHADWFAMLLPTCSMIYVGCHFVERAYIFCTVQYFEQNDGGNLSCIDGPLLLIVLHYYSIQKCYFRTLISMYFPWNVTPGQKFPLQKIAGMPSLLSTLAPQFKLILGEGLWTIISGQWWVTNANVNNLRHSCIGL